MGLAQAVDIRGKVGISPHLLSIYNKLRTEVDPLIEDRRMDIEITQIVAMIERGELS